MKKFRKALLLAALSLSAVCHAQQQIAIFSINDFHGAFVRNDEHALPVEMKNPFSLNARSMTCPGIPGNAA